MLNTSGLLYLSARAASAAGNLLAVAIFSRMAGAAEYGHYVLIFAWSLIVYGFGAQWMRFAYFGVYHLQRFDEYVASLARLLACGLVAVALVLGALGWWGLFESGFLVAMFALICGMTVYEAAFEVARTLLKARRSAVAMVLRTALMIGFGSASLALGGGARGLAFAIALAHVIAAVPLLAAFSGVRLTQGTRAASLRMLGYGWPLLLSFGISAAGQSIDRVLIGHYLGETALGPYGVVADLLRQSFTVFGEVIALSLITLAKQHANDADAQAADNVLRKAFSACLATATFGAAFFVVFGDLVLRVLLKPEFVAPTRDLVPFFAVAFAFTTMRNYYFAQVIYFTRASYLELVVSLLFLVTSSALSLLLLRPYGLTGAAIALMTASIVSCLAFAALGRRWYRMPVDLPALIAMPALAAAFVLSARAAAAFIPGGSAALVIDAIAFALAAGLAIRRFDLLSVMQHDAHGDQLLAR
jgi:O-antigen/teichoic acid export membrane protein